MSIKKKIFLFASLLLFFSTGLTILGVSYLTIVQTTAQNNNRLDNALNAFERVFTEEIAQVDTEFNAFTKNEDKARISYRVIKTDVDSGNISVEGFIKNLLYFAEDMGADSFALYFKKGKAYQQSIKFIYDRKLGGIIKVKPGGDEPDWFGIKDGYGIVQFPNTKYVLITLNEFGFLERNAIDRLNTYYTENCNNETSYSFKVKDGKIVLTADLIYNSPIVPSNAKNDSILGKFIIEKPINLKLSQIDQDLGIYSNVYDHNGKLIGGQIQMPNLDSSLIGIKNSLFLSMMDRHENKYNSILTSLEYQGSTIAYLAANISQKEVKQRVATTIGLLLIIASIILVFLMIIISKIVIHLVLPILELIQSASEIASGNLDTHINTSRTDEIGNLAHSFANMRDSIREKLNDLKKEITTRKQIENALRDSEERYRAIVEDSPNLICRFIPSMEITFVNEEYCKYFDIPYEELVGKKFLTLIPEKDRDFVKTNILALNADSPIQSHEHKVVSKNNELRWQQWTNRALFDEKGEIIAYQSIGRDITERKQAEEQIKASLREKEVLLKEIHHRVKNNMQVIISLLKLQSKNIADKQYLDMFIESQGRIKAMALVHEKLYQTKSMADVDFKKYVKSLVISLFRSYETRPDKIELKIEIGDVSLGLESAIPCGMIINELVSNSLKYAFPEEREGKIKVALNSTNEDKLVLEVSDNGIGMPEELDIRNTESMGLHLVTILSEDQLHGKIELNRTRGTSFHIQFKKYTYKARI